MNLARAFSGWRKFDRGLTQLSHCELHWLDVPKWIQYKLAVTVHCCLQGRTAKYLADCCILTSDVASRQRLRSASRYQLIVPLHRCSKFRRRALSVAGPMACNCLPDNLRNPTLSCDRFRAALSFQCRTELVKTKTDRQTDDKRQTYSRTLQSNCNVRLKWAK